MSCQDCVDWTRDGFDKEQCAHCLQALSLCLKAYFAKGPICSEATRVEVFLGILPLCMPMDPDCTLEKYRLCEWLIQRFETDLEGKLYWLAYPMECNRCHRRPTYMV